MEFDSARKVINHGILAKYLRKFLTFAYKQIADNDQILEFDAYDMPYYYFKCAQQDNATDCALFLKKYVECFFQKPTESYKAPINMEHWFEDEEVSQKREEIS